MKNNLFQRPNLKLFLLFALVAVGFKEIVIQADSVDLHQDNSSRYTSTLPMSTAEINELVERTLSQPTSQNYHFLAACYQKRGELDKAMHYLRKARLAAEVEE